MVVGETARIDGAEQSFNGEDASGRFLISLRERASSVISVFTESHYLW